MLYVHLFGTRRLEDDSVLSGRAAQRHPVALLVLLPEHGSTPSD